MLRTLFSAMNSGRRAHRKCDGKRDPEFGAILPREDVARAIGIG